MAPGRWPQAGPGLRIHVHESLGVRLHVDAVPGRPRILEDALLPLGEARGVGQSQAPRPIGGRSGPLSLPGRPGRVRRVHALGEREGLRLTVHAQPAVVPAEAPAVLVLGWLPLSQKAQRRRPRARSRLGVVLRPEARERQALEELGTAVVWVRTRSLALGVLVRPRRGLDVVHLQDVGGAAAEAAERLLGDVVRGQVHQVQVAGAQGVTGVVVTVGGEEDFRAAFFVRARL